MREACLGLLCRRSSAKESFCPDLSTTKEELSLDVPDAIADRFRAYGVDYAPALRKFRKAMDQPRSQKINSGCRAALDR